MMPAETSTADLVAESGFRLHATHGLIEGS